MLAKELGHTLGPSCVLGDDAGHVGLQVQGAALAVDVKQTCGTRGCCCRHSNMVERAKGDSHLKPRRSAAWRASVAGAEE